MLEIYLSIIEGNEKGHRDAGLFRLTILPRTQHRRGAVLRGVHL
jgi:hypothetical protein